MNKVLKILSIGLSLGLLTACGLGKKEPGTYKGEALGYNQDSPIKVEVIIGDEGTISSITTVHEDHPEIADQAIEVLTKDVIEANSPDVEAISGATETSQGFLLAVENALKSK